MPISTQPGDGGVVFLVDDDPSVLTALSRFLEAHGYETRTFSSPTDFLFAHDPDLPGCAVIDVSMPELNGLELQAALKNAAGVVLPIIFITGLGDVPTSVWAMKEGAVDFLTKPVDEDSLLRSVQSAIEQDAVSRRDRLERDEIVKCYETLTAREREVLCHVAAGRLNKQIAADFGISEKTIKLHRGRVMTKMKARSLAELVRLTDRLGVQLPHGG